ncbi:MAG: CHASE2 domain-containing protein [Azonexus sp.]|nr:CHASE2 domain-containing protein [Azonexus sp.]
MKAQAFALLRAGRGRALPLLLLALAILALHNIDSTPLASLRDAQFDRYQRQMPRVREDEPVIVVGIDSQSLAQHGQWPWSRDLIARLVDHIQAGKPLALGIDIVFAEQDRHSPEVLAAKLPSLSRSALAALPDPDRILARSLGGGPTALAIVGLSNPLPGSKQPSRPLPVFTQQPALDQVLPNFVGALASLSMLEDAAAGEGLVNASTDTLRSNTDGGILRRVPTIGLIEHQPFLSLPLEMFRLALREGGTVTPVLGRHGMEALQIGDYRFPTQANGELLLHFGRASSNYYLSAADVLAGIHPPEMFSSRFVIIGFNSTGLQDRVITPLGESLPGIDIHAQVIESLLTGAALKRPVWMAQLELAALLFGGLLLISTMPILQPRYAVVSFVALLVIICGGGYLAFHLGKWLFDIASQALLLSPIFISLLANNLIAADSQRREAEKHLLASREEAARVNGELDAARRIQMGLLPDPARLLADESRFAIAALLEPARAVGGDYFDCLMLDPRRLCLAIGDVSGKGVPASLFMAISKTLTSVLTRRQPDLGQAVRNIEEELSRENPEFLFVTAFIAVIDVESGEMEYVCAGHDAPILLRQGEVSRIDTAAHGGPPLCAIGDYPFIADRVQLQPNDLLCLFTDGVTEADNGEAMYGSKNLENAILQAKTGDLQVAVNRLRDSVRHFEAGHPPSDDLTLLLLRWTG